MSRMFEHGALPDCEKGKEMPHGRCRMLFPTPLGIHGCKFLYLLGLWSHLVSKFLQTKHLDADSLESTVYGRSLAASRVRTSENVPASYCRAGIYQYLQWNEEFRKRSWFRGAGLLGDSSHYGLKAESPHFQYALFGWETRHEQMSDIAEFSRAVA